jgi:hypothetical protein
MAQLRPIMKSSMQLDTLARSEWLSELATQSLIAEAELTPKPGLVDGRGSGSHSDLSLDLMKRSAEAIAPYFTRMAVASAEAQMNTSLRAAVAGIGREAEAAMRVNALNPSALDSRNQCWVRIQRKVFADFSAKPERLSKDREKKFNGSRAETNSVIE